ncbi:MAG: flagellar basal body P-ring protein FlgI [Planctomycetota bacterium]
MTRMFTISLTLLLLAGGLRAERIETIASIKGVRPLRISGRGLVTGLKGTGDKGDAAKIALQRFLGKQGINVETKDIDGSNVALVSVTAELPPFARPGQLIDIRVSSVNGAASLENGILELTRLRAIETGPVYAVASGRVLVGGQDEENKYLTTGSTPDGAEVVRENRVKFISDRNTFELLLNRPSFSTAYSIARAVNTSTASNPEAATQLGQGFRGMSRESGPAQALNAGTVIIRIPEKFLGQKVKYISTIMRTLNVDVDVPPKVVINRATGTVVITGQVRVSRSAIAHGNLSVLVEKPINQGQGNANTNAYRLAQPQNEQWNLVEMSETLGQAEHLQVLLKTLNAMKTRPRDIIAIIKELKRAGALHAELDIR